MAIPLPTPVSDGHRGQSRKDSGEGERKATTCLGTILCCLIPSRSEGNSGILEKDQPYPFYWWKNL